jgi:hypothetical protein
MFENRRWLVIPTSIIDNIDFNQIQQSNQESLRLSKDGSKTFIKYDVNVVEETFNTAHINPETEEEETYTTEKGVYGRPSIYSEDYVEYNHASILELLGTEAWASTEELI